MAERPPAAERTVTTRTKYPTPILSATFETAGHLRHFDTGVVPRRATELVTNWLGVINNGGKVWVRTFDGKGKRMTNQPEHVGDRMRQLIPTISTSKSDQTMSDRLPVEVDDALTATTGRLTAQTPEATRDTVKLAAVQLYTGLVNLVAGGGRVMVRIYNPGSQTPENGTPPELEQLLQETSYLEGRRKVERDDLDTKMKEQLTRKIPLAA